MRKLSVGILALVMVAGFAPSTASAYTTDTTRPVLLVHGIDPVNWACPGYDLEAYWGTMVQFLRSRGWSGPLVKVGYYACDYNATDTLDAYGSHSSYHGNTGHTTGLHGEKSHNQDADLGHLAYHLAWMIYTKYSSKGITAQLVTHSMGGMIARWMLHRVQSRDPAFPPYLYVQDVVAIAPPNAGVDGAYLCPFTQCQQLRPGSAFLSELNGSGSGRNPQATGGTDYSVMTSGCDMVVPASSALTMGPEVHKVDYSYPCYEHTAFLIDPFPQSDARVKYTTPPSSTFMDWYAAPHSLRWVDTALRSNAW